MGDAYVPPLGPRLGTAYDVALGADIIYESDSCEAIAALLRRTLEERLREVRPAFVSAATALWRDVIEP